MRSIAIAAKFLIPSAAFFLGVSTAAADCNIYSADALCLPGTLGYQAQQAQIQQQEDFKKFMERGAAAADRRNQNDPNSPYYLGTPAQQCEAAKHSLYCQLGISCAPPPDLDCERAAPRSAAVRRHTRQR